MKGNKTLGITLIAAVFATAVFAFFVNFTANEPTGLVIQNQEKEEVVTEAPVAEVKIDQLNPLPADEVMAVDSELSAIDAEMDALTEESLDDLSDIETSF